MIARGLDVPLVARAPEEADFVGSSRSRQDLAPSSENEAWLEPEPDALTTR